MAKKEINPLCPSSYSKGFIFGLSFATAVYMILMLTINAISGGLSTNIASEIYEYAGVFTGYTRIDIALLLAIAILVGLIFGISAKNLLTAFGGVMMFFLIEMIIFFGIGLLYLGEHYNYSDMFSDYMVVFVYPILISIVGAILGYFSLRRPSDSVIKISKM